MHFLSLLFLVFRFCTWGLLWLRDWVLREQLNIFSKGALFLRYMHQVLRFKKTCRSTHIDSRGRPFVDTVGSCHQWELQYFQGEYVLLVFLMPKCFQKGQVWPQGRADSFCNSAPTQSLIMFWLDTNKLESFSFEERHNCLVEDFSILTFTRVKFFVFQRLCWNIPGLS